MSVPTWKASHLLRQVLPDETVRIEIMLVDAAGYTREEWDSCDLARWTLARDGRWLYRGRAPAGEFAAIELTGQGATPPLRWAWQ